MYLLTGQHRLSPRLERSHVPSGDAAVCLHASVCAPGARRPGTGWCADVRSGSRVTVPLPGRIRQRSRVNRCVGLFTHLTARYTVSSAFCVLAYRGPLYVRLEQELIKQVLLAKDMNHGLENATLSGVFQASCVAFGYCCMHLMVMAHSPPLLERCCPKP